jgi:hypothetical protein
MPCLTTNQRTQVCAYLADDEGAAAAVERAQQLLPLPRLTAAEVQEVEAPAVVCSTAAAGGSAVKGSAVGAAGGGGAAAGCGGAVAAAAAAGAVAAVSVALAYLSLGQQ